MGPFGGGGGVVCGGTDPGEEGVHVGGDLGGDLLELLGMRGGVLDGPVEVVLAGVEGAGVAAAHGDNVVGGADDVVGEGLGEVLGQVPAAGGDQGRDGGIDLGAGH